MKKIFAFLLLFTMLLALSGCSLCLHKWTDATCEAPKTCSKCSKTEGDALGHEWVDASCEFPKTCRSCFATEGSALEHTCAEWKEVSDSVMSSVCTVCKTEVEADMDREVLGTQALVGKWVLNAYQIQSDDSPWEFCYDPSVWIEVLENGEFKAHITKDDGGTYKYTNYNKEYNNYWFRASFENGGWCEFRIDPEDGELYWVADSIWMTFERE